MSSMDVENDALILSCDDPIESETEEWFTNVETNKRLQPITKVLGLLCMSFNGDPYEFTLTNLSHAITVSHLKTDWLEDLEKCIQELNITDLYVLGPKRLQISKYVTSATVYSLQGHHMPEFRKKCPTCFRYGCSTFKASYILNYNILNYFNFKFYIPCIYAKNNNKED